MSVAVRYAAPALSKSAQRSRPMRADSPASATAKVPPKPQHSSVRVGRTSSRSATLASSTSAGDSRAALAPLAHRAQAQLAQAVAAGVQADLVGKARAEVGDAQAFDQELAQLERLGHGPLVLVVEAQAQVVEVVADLADTRGGRD